MNNNYGISEKPLSIMDKIKLYTQAKKPLFLHGKSGDGKSARVKQVDPSCVVLHMENATLESFAGIEIIVEGSTEQIAKKPTWLMKLERVCNDDPDNIHILFLDEFTHAFEGVQTKLNNLLTTRTLNGRWKLPNNCAIVAAGNEMEDSLAANPLDKTINDRFVHLTVATTVEEWLDWADSKTRRAMVEERAGVPENKRKEERIHPAVRDFIKKYGDSVLHTTFDGKEPYANPRKWEMVSHLLNNSHNPNILEPLIGKAMKRNFLSFCKENSDKYPDLLIADSRIDTAHLLSSYIQSDIPIFLHGKSGVGKSERIQQIDPDLTEVNIGNITQDMLVGGATYNPQTGNVTDTQPAWFQTLTEKCKREPNKIHILFFDEFTHAQPEIQARLNDLIVDRVLDGKWELPKNCRIVAAGNEIEDSEAANDLEETVHNRFAHWHIEANIDEWIQYAREHDVHPAVIDFVEMQGATGGKSILELRSPRRWVWVSDLLKGSGGNLEAVHDALRFETDKDESEELFKQFKEFLKRDSNKVITLRGLLDGDYDNKKFDFNIAEGSKIAERLARVDVNLDDLRKVKNFIEANFGRDKKDVIQQFLVSWLSKHPIEEIDLTSDYGKKIFGLLVAMGGPKIIESRCAKGFDSIKQNLRTTDYTDDETANNRRR